MPLEFLPHIRNYFRQERKPELADSPQPLLPEHTPQPDFLAEKQSVQLPTLELHEEKTHEQLSDEQLAEEVQKVLDGLLNEQNNERLFLSETVKEYAEPKHTAPESKESPKKKDVGEIAWFEDQIFKSEQQELEAKRQYDEALNEVRGELPETSISEDAEHLRQFEQKMGERDALGRELISQLKEKIDTLSVEELRTLTDKTAEFVLSEGEAWEEVISLVEKQKERHPERVEEIEAHSNALEKEAEAQKNLIPLTEEWLNVQDSAELARVAHSSYSVENFLAQHALLSEKEKENLKELVGILADNQLEENSLLGQALSLEDFQQRLREKQTEYLEKASQYPALADRLLLFAQKKFQVSTDFAMVRMALDACVKEVQSSASTSSSEEAFVSTPKLESVQSEKIEEEEEEVGSVTTPSLEALPKNPQMEAAQEELKRLEQRKLELQKILESQWQSSRNGQESVSSSTQ